MISLYFFSIPKRLKVIKYFFFTLVLKKVAFHYCISYIIYKSKWNIYKNKEYSLAFKLPEIVHIYRLLRLRSNPRNFFLFFFFFSRCRSNFIKTDNTDVILTSLEKSQYPIKKCTKKRPKWSLLVYWLMCCLVNLNRV